MAERSRDGLGPAQRRPDPNDSLWQPAYYGGPPPGSPTRSGPLRPVPGDDAEEADGAAPGAGATEDVAAPEAPAGGRRFPVRPGVALAGLVLLLGVASVLVIAIRGQQVVSTAPTAAAPPVRPPAPQVAPQPPIAAPEAHQPLPAATPRLGAQAPNSTIAPNGAASPNGATTPNGRAAPNRTASPNGTAAPNGTAGPNGAAGPNGTAAAPRRAAPPAAAARPVGGRPTSPEGRVPQPRVASDSDQDRLTQRAEDEESDEEADDLADDDDRSPAVAVPTRAQRTSSDGLLDVLGAALPGLG